MESNDMTSLIVSRRILVALLAILGVYGLALSTHRAEAQFPTQSLLVKQTGGSANAQTLVVPNVGAYADILGVPLTVIPSFTNTAPATFNVNGLGALSVVRLPTGIVLGGGEIAQNLILVVVYNGTKFVITSAQDTTPVSTAIDLRGSVAPTGYLIEDGSCVSQTTYAALFAVIGTSYGSCGAGLFSVPDSRGTIFAALDNQGSNGSANRITSAGSGCTATAVGLCGAQNANLSIANINAFTPTGTITNGAITINVPNTLAAYNTVAAGQFTSGSFGNGPAANPTASQATSTFTGASLGSGVAHSILNPISLGRRAIKY